MSIKLPDYYKTDLESKCNYIVYITNLNGVHIMKFHNYRAGIIMAHAYFRVILFGLVQGSEYFIYTHILTNAHHSFINCYDYILLPEEVKQRIIHGI